MPLDHQRLVIEPTFPNADKLMAIGGERVTDKPDEEKDPELEGAVIRNRFWSWRWRSDIVVWQERSGRINWGKAPGAHHMDQDLQTLGCADAWGLEQEGRAVRLLGTLLPHRIFKQYLLTGMFLETSKRSGICYMFRRLKPTLAISMRGDKCRMLAALCLHPIAYYAGSWGGALCPTDDVVSHLMLMRGDEKMFWRRANQHPLYRPEAGV